ncbi:Transposable element Tcb2 transposase [Octopus vulgaris]|uniref:Transposable element Tcb2 transposase n=1 Tax=Octopus vulgaris TaxID=6645 RepID=A0AA36FJ54_OCTVU|nr:Transposable element Tcb2 transposase [Octopus vulgaris]
MAHNTKVTPDLGKEIVKMKVSGMILSAISRNVRRSKSVISRVLKLYEETKGFELNKATGRPRKTTMRDDRAMKWYVMKDPFETAAGISKKIKVNSGTKVSPFTVIRRLKEFGLKTCYPATKPTIIKKNKLEKLSFVEAHVNWRDETCSKVHFSNESKFNLVGSYGRQYVRRFTGDWLNSKG